MWRGSQGPAHCNCVWAAGTLRTADGGLRADCGLRTDCGWTADGGRTAGGLRTDCAHGSMSGEDGELEFRRVQHPSGGFVLVPIPRRPAVPEGDGAPGGSGLPPDAVCRYTSKRCGAPRSLKRNGQLHNFCEFHRRKANENQRRLEQKKKQQRALGQGPGSSSGPGREDAADAAVDDALPALLAAAEEGVVDLGCEWDDWERELELKMVGDGPGGGGGGSGPGPGISAGGGAP
jgi:hypothetical protein